jgi:dephospho-CoA kinase
MSLAFVGHAAVGKDTLSDYVSQKLNLPNVSAGNLIRDYVLENNLGSLERENLKNVGNKLRALYGGDYLVKLATERYPGDLVMSGLRAVDEVQTFKLLGGIIIAITAPAELRYEHAKVRNRIDDTVSFEEWKHK